MSELPGNSESPILIPDSDALKHLLEEHGFDTRHWGQGPTKTVDALWEEVEQGETEILKVGPEIIRRTHVVAVDVLAKLESGQQYRLVEEKQVFRNGAERQRGLITSLGEKIKSGEDTESAVRRAVAEELGITSLVDIKLAGEQIVEKTSATYNGLVSQLLLKLARVTIPEEAYNPDGYVENQAEKTVHFKWEALEDLS